MSILKNKKLLIFLVFAAVMIVVCFFIMIILVFSHLKNGKISHDRIFDSDPELSFANDGEYIIGKVLRVSDGDTIVVKEKKEGGSRKKIRLYGIDCPETSQPYGVKAKEFVDKEVLGLTVWVDIKEKTDRWGRVVGIVMYGSGFSKNLNKELLTRGYAWWYKQYAKTEISYGELMETAQKKKRGLWKDPNPIRPWDWRNGVRNYDKPEPLNQPKPKKESGEAYWCTSSSGVRHNSNCKWFKKSKGSMCESWEGTACKICGG